MRRLIERIRRRFAHRSFALDELDRKLVRYIPRRKGFFVEAGANDGLRQSNTLYFERYRQWQGILVEPIPALAERCRINRPSAAVENCALVASGYKERFVPMTYCDLMSIVRGALKTEDEERQHLVSGTSHLAANEELYEIVAPARTLSSILDSHAVDHVDLLCLDVEGYEAEVLKGLDFSRHRPDFILVEVRFPEDADAVLEPWYRRVATLSEHPRYTDVLFAAR